MEDDRIHQLWLEDPLTLLKVARDGIYARAMLYRAETLGNIPVSEAQILLNAGEDLRYMSLWRGLPKKISERGTPGMTTDVFNREIIEPAKRSMIKWQQFQREKELVACSRTVRITNVLLPLIDTSLTGNHTVAILTLAILYAFDVVPKNWLPQCPLFTQTVPLYEFFHGPFICNPFAVCTLLQSHLSAWLSQKLNIPKTVFSQETMKEMPIPVKRCRLMSPKKGPLSPSRNAPSPPRGLTSGASSTDAETETRASESQEPSVTPLSLATLPLAKIRRESSTME
jgi:hypothetical protein